jgi:type IV pilus assembly protein PilC
MGLEDRLLSHVRISGKEHRRVTADDKLAFFQQLATLISSGTPLVDAIELAARQTASRRLRGILEEIAGRVAAGGSLRDVMSAYRDVFEDHWIELIGIGEVSGKMSMVLRDLNQQVREANETRRKVTGALVYPMILLLVAVVVVIVMLWFVVPTFAEMFDQMGAELPGVTQFVLGASDFIVDYGALIVVVGVGLVLFFQRYLKTEAGRRRMWAIALATPVLGDLLVQLTMFRFASNLALLLRSGVPMLETLSALGTVFRASPIYHDTILRAQERVMAGHPLADSLEETGLFTDLMTSMVRLGEASAQLPQVMDQMAPYYKERLNGFITRATRLMEPGIIVLLGGAIATIMLAIYLPMFDMAGAVK